MKIISRVHDKCEKCKYKDDCNEKRMMACAVMELPPNIKAPIKEDADMPIAREYTPITIYKGENCTIDTSLEEIKENLEKDFYKQVKCSFMR